MLVVKNPTFATVAQGDYSEHWFLKIGSCSYTDGRIFDFDFRGTAVAVDKDTTFYVGGHNQGVVCEPPDAFLSCPSIGFVTLKEHTKKARLVITGYCGEITAKYKGVTGMKLIFMEG